MPDRSQPLQRSNETPETDPCGHCLRPSFTAAVARALRQRRSVNPVAAAGKGGGRLLWDLAGFADDGGQGDGDALWLYADLKQHRYDYRALVARLWGQTGQDGNPPTTLGGLAERLDGRRPVVFLFDHFDAILDQTQVQAGYDRKFLSSLNNLHNRGMPLVCVTARPHSDYILRTRDGDLLVSTLPLDLEPLPPLSHQEISAEIERRGLAIDPEQRGQLARVLLDDRHPLGLLGYIQGRLANADREQSAFPQRLKRWQREHAKTLGHSGVRGLVGLRHWVALRWTALGLDRVLPWGRLGRWVTGLFKLRGRA